MERSLSTTNHNRRVINLTLNRDTDLHKTKNAWKPRKPAVDRDTETMDSEHLKTLETLKTLRSILNKLTPEKYDKLMKQVTELSLNTEERLMGSVNLIFEKAVSEQHYCEVYANACKHLWTVSYSNHHKLHHLVQSLHHIVMDAAASLGTGVQSACRSTRGP